MDNSLYDIIFKRKSFHIFMGRDEITPEELDEIERRFAEIIPLIPDIKVDIKIVPEGTISKSRGGEYFILLYSEKKDNYLQNIGYIGEQLDLFLPSLNIGCLWSVSVNLMSLDTKV